MSIQVLGRVKTVGWTPRNLGETAIRGHFAGLAAFRSRFASEAGCSSLLGRFCDGYYALIAIMSGWMPMMFITRVRL